MISDINQSNDNFYKCFRFLLIIGQFFGFFPCHGILSQDVNELKFSWRSLKVIATLCMGSVALLSAAANVRILAVNGFNMGRFGMKLTKIEKKNREFYYRGICV